MSMTSRCVHGMSRCAGIAAVMLCIAAGSAEAQQAVAAKKAVAAQRAAAVQKAFAVQQAAVAQQAEAVGRAVATAGPAIAAGVSTGWYAPGAQQVPQDVRIMQTIVTTALSQVAPPKMPSAGSAEDAPGGFVVGRRASFGRGDVSGFYMQGYGYLFTVRWPVSSSFALIDAQAGDIVVALDDQRRSLEQMNAQLEKLKQYQEQDEAAQVDTLVKADSLRKRVRADARRALERQREVQRTRVRDERVHMKARGEWAAQYRQQLSDALRDAIAGYGSTLRRARPGESITFIADFGGDTTNVTMTVKAAALHGTDVDANRSAIHVSRNGSGMSGRLRTQLQIMSQIIDTSLRTGGSSEVVFAGSWSTYFGGRADAQYVPGYGVIFRKNARLNTARTFARLSLGSRRSKAEAAVDSAAVAAREMYEQHLDTLRHRTADILATYGPTLTDLRDTDWVGIYYDVGSAAALLGGGADDYLVQARMSDIRQASAQSDPTAWLERRLVTNGKK